MLFNLVALKKEPCPVCGALCNDGARSLISPWIRQLGVTTRVSTYLICNICNTGFFTKRYSDIEMENIYQDYRGTSYMRIRERWEPWYSKSYNGSHDSEKWIASRKEFLSSFILQYGPTECDVVVDIGGNRGEYIPEFANQKYLLDISSKEPLFDVTRISALDELDVIDLIIYAHILEHVRNPHLELENLLAKTNCVYVEVPYGVPKITRERRSWWRFCLQLLRSLSHHLWRRRAVPATGRSVNATSILSQSEHLTFFSEESMRQLAERLDVSLVVKQQTMVTPDSKSAVVLQCLFTQTE